MECKFYTSFSIDDPEGILKFFDEHGFVVVDDVLTPEECDISKEEVWEYLRVRGVDALDTKTMENTHWPKEICRNGGFVGRFPFFGKMTTSSFAERGISTQVQAWKNRQNPKVYQVYSLLLRSKELWASVDRYGIMRPSIVQDCAKESTEVDTADEENKLSKPEWQTKKDWLHWDLSPFHYGTSAAGFLLNKDVSHENLKNNYGGLRLQGLINLVDCPVEVGGFHCVPKFQGERFNRWREENVEYGNLPSIEKRNFVEVPEDDPMRAEVTRVPARAGSLLVWNSQLPHGNFPNWSSEFRIVQYIKMIDANDPRELLPVGKAENFNKEDMFPEWQPDLLGSKLFGFENW